MYIRFGKCGRLILFLIVGLAAACGGGAEPTPVQTQPAAVAPPAGAPTPPPAVVASTATPRPVVIAPTPTTAPAVVAPSPAPAPLTPKYGGTLRTVFINTPATFDLHDRRDGGGWGAVIPLMNYLVQNYQGGDGIGPDLAQRWEISPDGKVYTFYLVQNATWHDGKPVTAADVVFSLNRIAFDKALPAAPFRFVFSPVEKIEALDSHTVRITLHRVSASFLAFIGAVGNVIFPQHAITQVLAFKPIGSGPFRFASYTEGVRVVVERNPTYFKKDSQGRALPYLDRLETYVIPSPAAKVAAFRTGRIDLMDSPTPVSESQANKVRSELPDVLANPRRTGHMRHVFPNRPPYNDVRIRKAFHLAMDRQAWDQLLNEGQGNPYVLFMGTGSRWGVPPEEVATWPGYRQPKDADVAEARRLLQEASFDLKRTVVYKTRDMNEPNATAAAAILQSNLGAKGEILVRDTASFIQDQRSQNFEILYDPNAPGIDDPSIILPQYYRSDGITNWGRFGDPELDRLIDALETTLDTKGRLALTQAIEKKSSSNSTGPLPMAA